MEVFGDVEKEGRFGRKRTMADVRLWVVLKRGVKTETETGREGGKKVKKKMDGWAGDGSGSGETKIWRDGGMEGWRDGGG